MLDSRRLKIRLNSRARWLEQAQRGQGLVEYALSLVLNGMLASVSLEAVGPAINEALCEAVETLNPDLGDSCSSGEETATDEEPTSGLTTILFAKYNDSKGELDVQAKAPGSCPFDLQIKIDGTLVGTMVRMGESYVFKYSGSPGSPPSNAQVGHPSCGGFVSSPVS
jgi:hypothetical protein